MASLGGLPGNRRAWLLHKLLPRQSSQTVLVVFLREPRQAAKPSIDVRGLGSRVEGRFLPSDSPGLPRIAELACGEAVSDIAKSEKKLERAKGFEPSTPTLARLCSTPELRPRSMRRRRLARRAF